MTGWIIAGVITLLVALIVFLPIGFVATFDGKDLLTWRIVGPIKTKLYPSPKKEKAKKNGPKQNEIDAFVREVEELAGDLDITTENFTTREGLSDLLMLLKIVLVFLNELRMVIPVHQLQLKIAVGGEDPGETALTYGATWAVVGNLFPILENLIRVKKRDIDITCDFDSTDTAVFAKAVLYMPLYRWVKLLGSQSGLPVVREYVDIKLRKGGIVK